MSPFSVQRIEEPSMCLTNKNYRSDGKESFPGSTMAGSIQGDLNHIEEGDQESPPPPNSKYASSFKKLSHGRSQPKTWGGVELQIFDFT